LETSGLKKKKLVAGDRGGGCLGEGVETAGLSLSSFCIVLGLFLACYSGVEEHTYCFRSALVIALNVKESPLFLLILFSLFLSFYIIHLKLLLWKIIYDFKIWRTG